MLKFFSCVLGEDYQILSKDTVESRKKVALFGSILFIPVVLWFLQGYGLSHIVLKGSVTSGIITGLIMAFMVFLLERAIIMTPSNKIITALRFFLGFLIAILGSIIIDEIIFHNDIDSQMVEYKKKQEGKLLAEVDSVNAIELSVLKGDMDEKFVLWKTALEEVKAEADGTGGSGIRGVSAITRLKKAATEPLKSAYETAKLRYEAKITQISDEKAERSAEFTAQFNENSLLTRLKVMFRFIFEDPVSIIIYAIITAFLFMLEFLVVILKVSYRKTNYEGKMEAIEAIGINRSSMYSTRDQERFQAKQYADEHINAERLINQGRNGYLKIN